MEAVVTDLEPEPFQAMLVQRVAGDGDRRQQGEMGLEGAGVLEHPGHAIAWRSPAPGTGVSEFFLEPLQELGCDDFLGDKP